MVKTPARSHGSFAAFSSALIALFTLAVLSACQLNMNTSITESLTPKLDAGSTITDGTLTVGVNASNTPYGGTNSSGDTVGLDVDVAAAIADELGCKLQIVDVKADGKAMLEKGSIDVALGVTKSGSTSAVSYSSAYLNDGASLFCLEENDPDDPADVNYTKSKILAQANSTACYEVQESLGIDSVTTYSSLQEAFEELEKGTGTYLACDAAVGDYFARSYTDIVRVSFLSSESVTPMYAITQTSNGELTIGLKDALTTIVQNGTLRVIVDKWLGTTGENLLPGEVKITSLQDILKNSE